jgi:hypothetical protein
MNIQEKIRWRYLQFIKYHFPFLWCKHLYKENLGKVTDFSKPKDINEKIQWLSFYTDTSMWTMLADKYAVRQYVAEHGGEDVLVPVLGKWDRAEDIDFNSLPDKFVIKPNNGSYDTVIVKDKSKADFEDIRRKMDHSMKHHFGFENAESHYLRIKPCIIAEQLLETNEEGGLNDYKIWCINGKPHNILVCTNRDAVTHHSDLIAYDLQWNRHPEWLSPSFRNESVIAKPEKLEDMLKLASKLSAGIPQVRVDLYCIKGKIYFGEMTMSSNFGMMPYYSQEVLNDMGARCMLPERSFSEKCSTFWNRWLPKF